MHFVQVKTLYLQSNFRMSGSAQKLSFQIFYIVALASKAKGLSSRGSRSELVDFACEVGKGEIDAKRPCPFGSVIDKSVESRSAEMRSSSLSSRSELGCAAPRVAEKEKIENT